jgi:hypothetical protein
VQIRAVKLAAESWSAVEDAFPSIIACLNTFMWSAKNSQIVAGESMISANSLRWQRRAEPQKHSKFGCLDAPMHLQKF